MKYIIYKRFKGLAICGLKANLPHGTECYSQDDLIWYNGFPLCKITSENAYSHFAIDEDNCGVERAKLFTKIKEKLAGKKILTKELFHNDSYIKYRPLLTFEQQVQYMRQYPYIYIVAPETQKLWDKIWDDKSLYKYKRPEREDYWLWNHDFYNAPIDDLKYIANLINVKYSKEKNK